MLDNKVTLAERASIANRLVPARIETSDEAIAVLVRSNDCVWASRAGHRMESGWPSGPCGTHPQSNAPTDGNEKATLVRNSTNPSKLCQPALKAPVVFGSSEQLLRVLTQHCAWIRAQVFDAIFRKPALDLG
jgi:hypothetical protein